MLQFLPDSLILWFTNILLVIGIVLTLAGFIVHRIPLLWKYQLPFKIVGVLLLAAGVYFRGGYGVEMMWRERVTELEKQVEEGRQRSEKVNTVFKDRVVYRDRVVTQQAETLVQYVDREVVKTIPAQCELLSNEIVEVHNRAARMNEGVQSTDPQERR